MLGGVDRRIQMLDMLLYGYDKFRYMRRTCGPHLYLFSLVRKGFGWPVCISGVLKRQGVVYCYCDIGDN